MLCLLWFLNSWQLSGSLFLSLGVLYRIMSANVKYYGISFLYVPFSQNHWRYTVIHLSKCLLVAPYFLTHCYSVNNSHTRLRNHVSLLLFIGKWCFIGVHQRSISRSKGPRDPRGWHSASFVFNFLLLAPIIIWTSSARSALMITSFSLCSFISFALRDH